MADFTTLYQGIFDSPWNPTPKSFEGNIGQGRWYTSDPTTARSYAKGLTTGTGTPKLGGSVYSMDVPTKSLSQSTKFADRLGTQGYDHIGEFSKKPNVHLATKKMITEGKPSINLGQTIKANVGALKDKASGILKSTNYPKSWLEGTYGDKFYKDVIDPAKSGKGPKPTITQLAKNWNPFKAVFTPKMLATGPTPAASKFLGSNLAYGLPFAYAAGADLLQDRLEKQGLTGEGGIYDISGGWGAMGAGADIPIIQKMLADRRATQKGIANANMQRKIQAAEAAAAQAAAATGHQAARERGGDYHSGHESTVGGQTTDWGPMSHMIAGGGLAQHAPIRPYSLGGLAYLLHGGLV